MDIITAQLAQPRLGVHDEVPGAGLAPPANDAATIRFQQMMQPPVEVQPSAPTATAEAVRQAYPLPPVGERTMGDSILAGLQNLSSDFRQSWQTVHGALDAGSNMTTTEMLKLQLGLTQMSIQYDLVGKAISRSTQNLDQLVKLQ